MQKIAWGEKEWDNNTTLYNNISLFLYDKNGFLEGFKKKREIPQNTQQGIFLSNPTKSRFTEKWEWVHFVGPKHTISSNLSQELWNTAVLRLLSYGSSASPTLGLGSGNDITWPDDVQGNHWGTELWNYLFKLFHGIAKPQALSWKQWLSDNLRSWERITLQCPCQEDLQHHQNVICVSRFCSGDLCWLRNYCQ